MSEKDEPNLTRAGLFSDLAGKAKETVGEIVGNEDLADEGRGQQAAAEDDTAA